MVFIKGVVKNGKNGKNGKFSVLSAKHETTKNGNNCSVCIYTLLFPFFLCLKTEWFTKKLNRDTFSKGE